MSTGRPGYADTRSWKWCSERGFLKKACSQLDDTFVIARYVLQKPAHRDFLGDLSGL